MFDGIEAELDRILADGFALGDTHAAVDAIDGLERIRRKVEATAVELQAELDRSQVRLRDVDLGPSEFRCETIDGVPLEPLETAASSLLTKVRRVVVDAAGVVIDLGRARRFTGSSRRAVQLGSTHCPWPGCSVPTSQCEIDHTHDHAKGGRTHPGNGGPFCGRHNRLKQQGFAVWRDPTGHWHVARPDGTEIG